jgi:hypothetical protein
MGNFSCSKLGKLCLIMLVYVGSEGPSPLGKVQCVWDKPTVLMWLRKDRLGKMRHGNQKSEAKKNIVLKNSFIWSMHAFLCVLIWFCFIRPHWAVAHSGKTPSLTLLTWLLCPENCASIFFFSGSTGVWTQDLTFARQALLLFKHHTSQGKHILKKGTYLGENIW